MVDLRCSKKYSGEMGATDPQLVAMKSLSLGVVSSLYIIHVSSSHCTI